MNGEPRPPPSDALHRLSADRGARSQFATAAFATSALALAETPAKPACDGKHEGHGQGGMFKKADKNNDGFLTKDEVGDKRWERIKVADANKDNKVSHPELQQARKDGKLPHGHKGPKA